MPNACCSYFQRSTELLQLSVRCLQDRLDCNVFHAFPVEVAARPVPTRRTGHLSKEINIANVTGMLRGASFSIDYYGSSINRASEMGEEAFQTNKEPAG